MITLGAPFQRSMRRISLGQPSGSCCNVGDKLNCFDNTGAVIWIQQADSRYPDCPPGGGPPPDVPPPDDGGVPPGNGGGGAPPPGGQLPPVIPDGGQRVPCPDWTQPGCFVPVPGALLPTGSALPDGALLPDGRYVTPGIVGDALFLPAGTFLPGGVILAEADGAGRFGDLAPGLGILALVVAGTYLAAS